MFNYKILLSIYNPVYCFLRMFNECVLVLQSSTVSFLLFCFLPPFVLFFPYFFEWIQRPLLKKPKKESWGKDFSSMILLLLFITIFIFSPISFFRRRLSATLISEEQTRRIVEAQEDERLDEGVFTFSFFDLFIWFIRSNFCVASKEERERRRQLAARLTDQEKQRRISLQKSGRDNDLREIARRLSQSVLTEGESAEFQLKWMERFFSIMIKNIKFKFKKYFKKIK